MNEVEHKAQTGWLKKDPLKQHTPPQEQYFKDKSVVIVGPSPSLKGSGQGKYIDSFDIVVRVNKGWWPASTIYR